MAATPWTELSVTQTGWMAGISGPGDPVYVVVGGAVQQVMADASVTWTKKIVPVMAVTERTVPATAWTERTL